LRLVLGKDAYDLLEAKRTEEKEELNKWRPLGEAIAFDDAEFVAIGKN
jgi:short-chain dehydrogenase/reductase SDR